MAENVILVDENDKETGLMEKMQAHLQGKLHRAFSVFIFNTEGKLLLQKRAENKYHSAGKWTNTCCSHPRQGEETIDAAHRRLNEEMGMKCDLIHAFHFIYKAELLNGIIEYEYDHVFFGLSDQTPVPDPAEVASFEYIAMNVLAKDIYERSEQYTEWMKICFDRVRKTYRETLDFI